MTSPGPRSPVVTWPPAGSTAADACADLAPLAAALEGSGPAVAPDPDVPGLVAAAASRLPEDLAVVVATSGSTGAPKHSLLTGAAVTASGRATESVLSGPGHWLLALPPTHIAGIQVLARSLLAGTTPLGMSGTHFDIAEFAALTARLTGDRPRYTSLVPTQLVRLLADPDGRDAARAFDAILVGGAALPQPVRDQAAAEGLRLVRTYGMSETAGGCVYGGVPLPGTEIRLADDSRISLGGPTLASGYLEPVPDNPFSTEPDGTRWFRTDDLGELDDGVLRVLGRADDIITTGGLKVAPVVVETAVLQHVPGVAEAVAVGLPDAEWGQIVAVALRFTDAATTVTTEAIREALRPHLPAHALPRRAIAVDAIPLRGPGKPDRSSLIDLLTA